MASYQIKKVRLDDQVFDIVTDGEGAFWAEVENGETIKGATASEVERRLITAHKRPKVAIPGILFRVGIHSKEAVPSLEQVTVTGYHTTRRTFLIRDSAGTAGVVDTHSWNTKEDLLKGDPDLAQRLCDAYAAKMAAERAYNEARAAALFRMEELEAAADKVREEKGVKKPVAARW